MRTLLLFILSATLSFAQGPINGTNLRLTGVPVQGAAASLARLYSLSAAGVGESVTPTVAWSAIVLTGTVDTTDITGISAFAQTYLDDTTVGATRTTLGGTTIGQSYFTLTNPGAITFPRQDAANTVTSRTAAELKTDLTLNNVDNTSDANKPVSTAQQTALNLKANAASPVFSGLPSFASPAPTVASAGTIALTTPVVFVSGTTQVDTITVPAAFATSGGTIIVIPTGVFTTGTGGNIALAVTAVVSKALHLTYDSGANKWFPSYQ